VSRLAVAEKFFKKLKISTVDKCFIEKYGIGIKKNKAKNADSISCLI